MWEPHPVTHGAHLRFRITQDKQSYVKVNGQKLDELALALRNDTMDEYYAANG